MSAAAPMALVGAGLLMLGGAVFLGRELGAENAAAPPRIAANQAVAVSGPAPRPPAKPEVLAMVPAVVARPLAVEPAAAADLKPTPSAPEPKPASAETQTAVAAVGVPDNVAASPSAAQNGAVATATAGAVQSPPASGSAGAAVLAKATAPANTVVAAGAAKPYPAQPIAGAGAAPVPGMAPALAAPPPPALAPIRLALTPPPLAAAALPGVTLASPVPADQAFSPVPIAGGTPAYPAELAADGRPGRVAVTCQVSAEGLPAGCHATASRGGPAFAAVTLAWLARSHVRYRPVILHGHAVAGLRNWTVAIEEPAALLAEAKRRQSEAQAADTASATPQVLAAAPAPVAGPPPATRLVVQPVLARQIVSVPKDSAVDGKFSTHVIAGGNPAFPPSYDEGRPGAVTVGCMISEAGTPGDCRILKAAGGSAFGKSVQAWLGSGKVRFRPVTSGGQPVAHAESWTIVFNSVPLQE